MGKELAALQKELAQAQHNLVKNLAEDGQKTAKGMFGVYQPGWAPLAKRTLETHEANAGTILGEFPTTNTPLFVTGHLRDSVKKTVQKNESAVGTDDEVMLTQEFGAPNPWSGAQDIPARPVFEPTAHQVYDRMSEHVKKTVGVVFKHGKGDGPMSGHFIERVTLTESEDE
ncbi:MAG: hypothetical protein K0041_04380 [Acidithiobacillus sp.]|nr:hypothetical protein [Acidithiobacillus sp.]